jgi:RecB family exonuclease
MQKTKTTHDTTVFTLSHSSLGAIEKCRYSWYLKYVEKKRVEKDNDVTDFGNLCHEIAENYFGGGQDEIKRLFNLYNQKYILTQEYAAKLPLAFKRIEAFYNAKLANSSKVYHEKEFRIALSPYIDVTGKIDVLYRDEEENWCVVDYKTSKKTGDHTAQFAFYYYLISKVTGKTPKKLKFQGVYLCAGSGFEIDDFVKEEILEADSIEDAENRIGNGINTILALDVDDVSKWKPCPSVLCSWCEYQNCEPQVCKGNGKGKRIK